MLKNTDTNAYLMAHYDGFQKGEEWGVRENGKVPCLDRGTWKALRMFHADQEVREERSPP